jgi:hypothetical protein
VLFMPIGYSFRSIVVLGVRGGKPMHVVVNKSIETDEREYIAPPVVLYKKETKLRGSQP